MYRTETEFGEEGSSRWDESSSAIIARDEVTILGEISPPTKTILRKTPTLLFLYFIQLTHRPFSKEVIA